jgi:predicted metal-dependent hydrolase
MKMRAQDIEFTLIRTRRKTADIVVERTGEVTVRAPHGLESDRVRKVVADRALWVHRALAEWEDFNGRRPRRIFKDGEGFDYLGRTYRLKLDRKADQPLMLKNGRWLLSPVILDLGGPTAAQKAFRDFYVQKGGGYLRERVVHFAPLVGVQAGTVAVRELGFHWASCGKGGRLNFHWKLMQAPRTIIDYVVVHELCHMRHRDHSDAFWNEVDKVLPTYRDRRDWLRRHGAGLDVASG